MRRSAAVLLTILVALAGPAWAQKAQDTLRVVWRDAVPNVDPYYNSQRTGLIVAHHVWDTLIYRDPETFQLKAAAGDLVEVCGRHHHRVRVAAGCYFP